MQRQNAPANNVAGKKYHVPLALFFTLFLELEKDKK